MPRSPNNKGITPGQQWLSLPADSQIFYLKGITDGLNQGLRHLADEVAFTLATSVSQDLSAENKLAVDSLMQQLRTWSKAGVSKFKYSKPVEEYCQALVTFYQSYPEYQRLSPAYLLIYMDDHHGMTPPEIFRLHEHSFLGFKR